MRIFTCTFYLISAVKMSAKLCIAGPRLGETFGRWGWAGAGVKGLAVVWGGGGGVENIEKKYNWIFFLLWLMGTMMPIRAKIWENMSRNVAIKKLAQIKQGRS